MIERIGQLFITGFEGITPSEEFLKKLASENIGGIILFEEQCNPHKSAEESIKKIASISNEIPFVAVDQEGGRVCRFRGAPAEFKSPAEFGRKNDRRLYEEQLSRSVYYIRSLGVNLLLAPVADIGLKQENQCLKGRTFGKTPARVMPFVELAVRIIHKAGLLTCLKHFPGFGAAIDDPHKMVSQADYDLQIFLNREALPFKAGIDSGADMVMTTHLLLPRLDHRIATESEIILNLLLREKLNFDGIAITDDLLMAGADSIGNFGERALRAFNAGHDILLFGRNHRAAFEAVAYFKEEYKKGNIDDDRLSISLDRISGIKSKLTASVIL
nr:hypothetical protein [candidate division Zixibacteria bacterium]